MLFTFYTALLSLYAIVLLIARGVNSIGDASHNSQVAHSQAPSPYYTGAHHRRWGRDHRGPGAEGGGKFILMILLLLEAILFGLFTFAMCTEQISSILSDQTGIERLKKQTYSVDRGIVHNLSETFGRPFSILWLLPTTVRYHGLTWIDLLPSECEV